MARTLLLLLEGGCGWACDAPYEAALCRSVFQASRTPANDELFFETKLASALLAALTKALTASRVPLEEPGLPFVKVSRDFFTHSIWPTMDQCVRREGPRSLETRLDRSVFLKNSTREKV